MSSTRNTNHAVNIRIYKVYVPNEEYKKIFKASETFHYQGRINKITKTVAAGVLLVPASVAICALFFPSIIYNDLKGGPSDQSDNPVFRMFSATVMPLFEISRYGYSCQTGIPASWIRGKANYKGEVTINNPDFITPSGATSIIYVLDGHNPTEVWQKGISCVGIEHPLPVTPPLGKVIFFSDPWCAYECARLRKDGEMYDERGGWRRYHAWTDEERADIVEGAQVTNTILAHTNLPRDVVNIMSEYLGFFKRKSTTQPIHDRSCSVHDYRL